MKLTIALAVTSASISTMALAQTQRDLDSHEHGVASLNVAIDSNSIFLELETPWNNIIGFEHAPRTPEQHTLFDDALALLNQPEQLFTFDGADCVATETIVDNSLAASDGHGDNEHDAEHDNKHDAEHDDKHDDEHDDHSAEAESHSSLLVSYSFDCNDMAQLVAIDVDFLKQWSGFEDLDVQLIGPGGQASLELNPQLIRMDITPVR